MSNFAIKMRIGNLDGFLVKSGPIAGNSGALVFQISFRAFAGDTANSQALQELVTVDIEDSKIKNESDLAREVNLAVAKIRDKLTRVVDAERNTNQAIDAFMTLGLER